MKKHNKIKKIICILLLVFLLNQIISIITGTNFLSTSIKGILNRASLYTKEIPSIEIKSNEWNSNMGGEWRIDKSAKWTSTSTAEVILNVDSIIKKGNNYKDVIFVLDVSGSMDGDKITKVKSDAIEVTKSLLDNENNRVALITFESTANVDSKFTNDKETIISIIDSLNTGGNTNYNDGLKNIELVMNNYEKKANRDLVVLFLTDGYPNEETPNQIATYEILKEKYPYMNISAIQYEMGDYIVDELKSISDNQYFANMETLNNILFEASISPEVYEKFEIVDYIHDDYFFIESSNDIEVSIGKASLSEENNLQKITWNLGDSYYQTGKKTSMKINLKLKEQYIGIEGFYPTNKREEITSKLVDEKENNETSTLTPVLKSSYEVIYDTNPPTGCNIKMKTSETHFIYELVTKKSTKLTCPGYSFKGWEIVDNIELINNDTFVMPPQDVTIRAIWTKQIISKSMNGTIAEKATFYNLIKNEAKNGTYGAEYIGTESENLKSSIYYLKNDFKNYNVLFGGFCWKMLLTTDTGGVKLIYNGEPDENNTCNNKGSASHLKLISPNNDSNSLAYLGYMYNKTYTNTHKFIPSSPMVGTSTMSATTKYHYADSYEWNGTEYILKNKDNSEVQSYLWEDNYENLKGLFYCPNTIGTNCQKLYYIIDTEKTKVYRLELFNGNSIEKTNFYLSLSNSYTKTENGYTLNDPIKITKEEWFLNQNEYNGYYMCSNHTSSTCEEIIVIKVDKYKNKIIFSSIKDKYLYGNSFTYNESTKEYTLIDTLEFWEWPIYYKDLSNYHYTCLNLSGSCKEIVYIHRGSEDGYHYLTLTDGKSIEEVIEEMLHAEDVNMFDSAMKNTIDSWFEKNFTEYEKYLEDTIYCNDRRIHELGGFTNNGSISGTRTGINLYPEYKKDFTCPNINDRFTKSSDIGNGKLKYKVGFLTANEANLVGKYILSTNYLYRTGTTNSFDGSAYGYYINTTGSLMNGGGNIFQTSYGINPVISLKPGTEYISGDGSNQNPFIVNTKE